MQTSPRRRSGSGETRLHLINQGEASPCLLINPVFTITANNWAAACDAAATRRCYPKVRQKSKSSGASPSRQVSPGRKSLGEEFINIITSTESVDVDVEFGESVYEDYGSHTNSTRPNSFHSNPYLNTYYGSSKLLQVPSSSTLLLPHDPYYDLSPEVCTRQQRSSSITVPIQHMGRSPERSSSEVFIRRCSSASPKGRYAQYRQQYQQQYLQQQQPQRLSNSNNTSPNHRNPQRGRGFSLTITQTQQQQQQFPDGRRASYSCRRRRSSHSQQRRRASGVGGFSSSSSSQSSPGHSPARRGSTKPHPLVKQENTQLQPHPQLERQRTFSMPNTAVPLGNKPLSRRNSHKQQVTTTASSGSGADAISSGGSNVSKKEVAGGGGGCYDVVIIGSPNVGKSTLSEYFNKGGSSGSDQGIGSDEDFEEDSYDDQDLVGGSKAILFRPQGDLNHPQFNFSLRIFCQQISAVNHLYKYDAVIILYSVTDRDSFEFARKALNEILPLRPSQRNNHAHTANAKKVVILVANKSDLERSRCVSPLEGRSLATAYDVKFIEISSSLGVGITELQKGLATQVHLRHKEKKVTPPKKTTFSSSSSSSFTSSKQAIITTHKKNAKGGGASAGNALTGGGRLALNTGKKGALSSLRLAQKLIDRIMSLKIVGNGAKSKSCLDLHSL